MDPVDALLLGLDAQRRAMAVVTDPAASSRCDGWTVGDVLDHSIGVTMKLTAFARGDTDRPHAPAPEDVVPLDEAVAAAREAWLAVDRSRTCHLGFGSYPAEVAAGINLFDVLAHTWDVGVVAEVSDDVWRWALDVARVVVGDDRDPRHYAPEVPAPPDAPPSVRLLAFLGR